MAGTLVVTANNRLARLLRAAGDAVAQAAGLRRWPEAEILAWHAWLEREWRELALGPGAAGDAPLLLTEAQERWLWRERIAAEVAPGLAIAATAAEAARAWAALHEHEIAMEPAALADSPDAMKFDAWQRDLRSACRHHGWITHAELARALAARLASGQWRGPERIELAGFSIPSAGQRTFVAALAAAGRSVAWRAAPEAPQPRGAVVAEFADPEAELRAAARWARRARAAGETGRVAVVVPDLSARRAAIERIFADELAPTSLAPGREHAGLGFDISLAPPLAARPLARAALGLLQLAAAAIEFSLASLLLRSPYWGAASEWTARARLEAELRETAGVQVALAELVARARHAHANTPATAAALARLRQAADAWRAKRRPSEWADAFAAAWRAAGWPGERALSSTEYQGAAACHELLDELACLDEVAPSLACDAALAELERLAAERLFQPQTTAAGVQILGLLEAAGLDFEHLWVAGLDAEAWPGAARPLPFLRLAAQIAAGVPRASAALAWEWARSAQARLLAAARQTVLSSARHQQDRDTSASPLLATLPRARPGEFDAADDSCGRRLLATGVFEEYADESGPPATEREYRGGVSLLADQAACPFRAFARGRLAASGLAPGPEPGFDARVRGELVHLCFKHYGLARLAGAPVPDIAAAAAAAVREAAQRYPLLTHRAMAAGERERLERLLAAWIENCENGRSPFEIVAIEQTSELDVAGLRLRVRVDRVDHVAGAGDLVIDYKTGRSVSVNAWEGDRPDDPQMPLYAAYAQTAPAGAALARLRPDRIEFQGWGAAALAPGITARDWSEQLRLWRAALESLAREFLAGEAGVAPKHGAETCKYCDAAALCRIAERGGPGGSGDDE